MQAAQEGCRHLPTPSFAAGYLSHICNHPLLAQHLFPCASYSSPSSTFPIPTTPCPPAPDPISASVPPMPHPLPCPHTLPFSLSLPTYPRAFLTSALAPLSPEASHTQLLLLLNKWKEWMAEENGRTRCAHHNSKETHR